MDVAGVRRLQHDLLRTHAVAVGPALSEWEVRAMLLLRAHVLALGHSGVRPLVAERLIEFLNREILPVVLRHLQMASNIELQLTATASAPSPTGGAATPTVRPPPR